VRYSLVYAKTFRKSIKRIKRSVGFDAARLESIIDYLGNCKKLPSVFRDHELKGDYVNCRECHVTSDILLIYRINDQLEIITIVDIGSHSQLFG
jgi:mRNA interferase YafQ